MNSSESSIPPANKESEGFDLSVIIVNWNSVNYLRECLTSIYGNCEGMRYEVIVVDNASPQRDIEQLPAEFPGMVLVKSGANLGFAGANNLGFYRSRGNHLLFLNPDTRILGSAIQTILSHAKDLPRAGIVGCKLLNTDGSIQTSCIQRFPTILNQALDVEFLQRRWPQLSLWGIAPLFADKPAPAKVEVVSGACMMVGREVFQRVSGFSEDYFMYAEDLDLCHKVMKANFDNYYVGDAEVIHHGGKSSGQREVNEWATQMKFRSILHFCKKTRGAVYSWLFRFTLAVTAFCRLILIAVAFPFGKAATLKAVFSKWRAVLKIAVGLDNPVLRTATDQ
jgi:N-acetylglucosaminyl-diphospho-decaprenol L-rhamnosyltransferase